MTLPLLDRSNYDTHSIVHRCFPPLPDQCLLCKKEGDALWQEPCTYMQFDTPGTNQVDLSHGNACSL